MPAGKQTRARKTAKKTTRKRPADSKSRVQKHRDKMRAEGLRPVQMWVLDTRKPSVLAEIKRQCLLVRDHPQEKQILDEIEALTDFDSWK